MPSVTHKWVSGLLEDLGAGPAKKELAAALERCGRRCLPQSTLQRARAATRGARTRAAKLAALARVWPHLEIKGNRLAVTYPRCYCPIMRGYKGPPVARFCECSRGWIRALVEETVGGTVRVTAEKTVLRGGDSCRFRVTFAR